VLLTFYLLFYFLRDRREVLHHARLLSPLTDAETDRLFVKVSDTIHGVIFGTVIAAGACLAAWHSGCSACQTLFCGEW
jgi:predicted PurR-regulated permease PerM